jgi:hypothetical protein
VLLLRKKEPQCTLLCRVAWVPVVRFWESLLRCAPSFQLCSVSVFTQNVWHPDPMSNRIDTKKVYLLFWKSTCKELQDLACLVYSNLEMSDRPRSLLMCEQVRTKVCRKDLCSLVRLIYDHRELSRVTTARYKTSSNTTENEDRWTYIWGTEQYSSSKACKRMIGYRHTHMALEIILGNEI